ncbi:MAG TPA: hypothetical protein VHZ54_10530 [Solirubrobacterales bacterium]|nr:hypothetical protein [Solirubrobacterales bacterium]
MALTAFLVASLVLVSAARASSIHIPAGSFGAATSTPANPYPLGAPGAVAVDNSAGPSAHDLYVTDPAHFRIEKFDPEGHLLLMFGKEVNKTAVEASGSEAEQDVCVIASTDECQSGVQGNAGKGQLSEPTFIAVDSSTGPSSGDVYVADTGTNVVYKFGEDGAFISENDGEGAGIAHFRGLKGVAVDTAGNVSILDGQQIFGFTEAETFISGPFPTGGGGVEAEGLAVDGTGSWYAVSGYGSPEKIDSSGKGVGRVLPASPPVENGPLTTGLVADQSTDDLYVDTGLEIEHIAPSCDPSKGLCQIADVFGSPTLVEGKGPGIDEVANTVYVADPGTGSVHRFTSGLEATTGLATGVMATTATLEGTVNPKGSAVTECVFEYGTSAEYGHSAPCEGAVGAGTVPVPVTARIAQLAGGTTYHYRITARNGNGSVVGEGQTFTTEAAPTVDEAFATDVTAGSATLNARIDPHGVGGTYRFEYGTTTAYDQSTAEESIGTGSAAVLRSQAITGLTPDTTWHFRVVVEDTKGDTITSEDHTFVFIAAGPAACPDQALRTGPSAHLPDCRGYEMVTPPQKNGALIGATFPSNFAPTISPDGLRVGAASIQCFAGPLSCIASREAPGQVFEFSRASGGWQAQPLSPPASAFPTFTWQTFGAEPGTLLFRAPLSDSTPDSFYLRRTDGSLIDVGPYSEHVLEYNLRPVILLSHLGSGTLVYGTTSPVWAMGGAPVNTSSLYEYVGSGNTEPQLVGVSGGAGSTDLISACGTAAGSAFGSLSADGRIVYFTALACSTGTGANAGHPVPADALYERVDGARTIQVSVATSQNCSSTCRGSAPRDASFEGGSGDGSKVFFTSTQQLTDEASQDNNPGDSATAPGCARTSAAASGCSLYLSECPAHCEDPSQRRLIDVSAGASGSGGPKVQGATAISPDGTHAYFVAKGVLTSAADVEGKKAQLGANNLYLYERDGAHPDGRLSFVATLSPNDSINWRPAGTQGIAFGFANTTPDGRFLVFTSHRGLTADARQGEGSSQVYRFDSVTGELTRISIGRKGFADDGNAAGPIADASIAASFRAFELGDGPARANPTMSDDGRYVFFESPAALTPGALDEVPTGGIQSGGSEHPGEPELAENVYEWAAPGTPSCTEPRGCVFLISDGTDVAAGGKIGITPTELLGTDESGEDVFFATNSQLVGKDTDTQRDYYDARVDGGEPPEAEQVVCEEDACKGQGTAAAQQGPPATPNVNGPEEGPRHPRQAHKKHKHKKKHAKHGKHHKQKHQKKHKDKGRSASRGAGRQGEDK